MVKARDLFPEEDYFQNALDVAKRYDLFSIIKKAGYSPDGKVKQRSNIEVAISKATGKKPALRCNFNKSNTGQLHKIVLYVIEFALGDVSIPYIYVILERNQNQLLDFKCGE